MIEIDYPTVDEIQYYNTIAIEMFRKSKRFPKQNKRVDNKWQNQKI